MARGRSELRQLLKNGIEETKHMVDENIWRWWQQEWEDERVRGTWTKRLIPRVRDWVNRPHGVTSYYLTQMLTGHGCFQAYLHRFARTESAHCLSCGDTIDDAEHTFFKCSRWARKLEELEVAVNRAVSPETIVPIMLYNKGNWEAVERYVTLILRIKEQEERPRR
uniref:Retrovirus-related Pol polyprotein from type-1 retrotransposable element R1 2 n=1 Tax=Schizaphis graminum TaxID=13262 RepID=A0A2S2NUP1_SCHGA